MREICWAEHWFLTGDVVMQEELRLGEQALTTHTQPPSQTYRVQLSPEILDPLCHGLGHAIYRLAFGMQRSSQSPALLAPPAAAIPGGSAQRPQVPSLQPALGMITGEGCMFCECNLMQSDLQTHTERADLRCRMQKYKVYLAISCIMC